MQDLQLTRSVEMTTDNILEGRIQVPFPTQAIERGPLQGNSSSEPQGEFSGAVDQASTEPDNIEARGGRFSKSADERQKMLKQRKEEMLQEARRRFLNVGSEDQGEELPSIEDEAASQLDLNVLRHRAVSAATERQMQNRSAP
uniref:E3 ubiquitin-protein ligase AMFR Ube2g2-binding region domain-containing protein n=1 Tax=Knipowitschia caucasica TaxID=637954 RepID=A0AAV2LRJ3_KNICA